jgi:class 3 adenylate cyclase/tetratricopeptide (TPR) repeat protein
MQCPRCQASNRPGARFCRECGAPLGGCPTCGAVLEPGSHFCDSCGATLEVTSARATSPRFASPHGYTPRHLAERILTSREAIEGERKQVTVLFADITGSTQLVAERDPDEARQLLDPVLERMMEVVHRYEGMVNQVLGDGIMALFGAPLALEDHALRACYAALGIQAEIAAYAVEVRRAHGATIQVRIGLNSGEVLVRAIGSNLHMDYSAVGLTTHLASRMEQLADPGQILLSADTLRLVEGYVDVTAVGPVPIRGLPGPIEVFRLRGPSAARTRLQAVAARGLTQFVGRQREMDAIAHALAEARLGRGQLMALVGEPGVGKSRLVWEFGQSQKLEGCLTLESRSVSYGRATAYGPVRDLLRGMFGIGERDDRPTIRERVTAKVVTLDRLPEDTIPAVLNLFDALPEASLFRDLDPLDRRQRTLEVLRRLLLRESEIQPLVLIVEDLHWIDSETQSLVDSLVESLPTARILLLVNYRPEYHHGWASKSCYGQIRVDPLPPENADEFLDAMLGHDPDLDPLKALLIDRTARNPFFLEECIRTLVETHALDGTRGAYRPKAALDAIRVPATVHAVLASRIDRLPPEEKALLQTASAIGKDFSFALLRAITDVPHADLRAGLTDLQTAEFVHESRLFPELEYTFKHTLTHEVTYGSLVQERRKALHARVAQTLEEVASDHPDDRVERLAHHALRGEVWAKAVPYLRRAGEKMAGQSAYRQAIGYLEQALGALAHLPETSERRAYAIDLRFDLRNALFALGELDQILDHLAEAKRVAEALGDRGRLGWVAAYMTHYFWRIGDHSRAVQSGKQAVAIGQEVGDLGLRTTNVVLGLAYYAMSDYAQAIECFADTVAALKDHRTTERFGWAALPAVTSRAYLAACLGELGRFAEGIRFGHEAITIAETANHAFSLGQAYLNTGVLHVNRGDLTVAAALLERGSALGGISKVTALSIGMAAALGHVYARSGRLAEGIPLLEQGVEKSAVKRIMARHSLWAAWLAEAYLLAERVDEARTVANRALLLCRERQERGTEAHVLRIIAEIAAWCEDPDAETAYREALTLAEQLGMRPLVARCHLGCGAWYRRAGRGSDARRSLTAAAELFRAMEMGSELTRAEAEVSALAGGTSGGGR